MIFQQQVPGDHDPLSSIEMDKEFYGIYSRCFKNRLSVYI